MQKKMQTYPKLFTYFLYSIVFFENVKNQKPSYYQFWTFENIKKNLK